MSKPHPGRLPAQNIEATKEQVERLKALSLEQLRTAWRLQFKRDVVEGLSRDILLRMLAWKIQERAFGGYDSATIKALESYGRRREGSAIAQRHMRAGTVLVREYQGVRHTVTVAPDGFIWQDKVYSNLSKIACMITGSNWNGPRFFGLRRPGNKKKVELQVQT